MLRAGDELSSDLQGSKPLVFMCQHRGSAVRVVHTALPDGAKPGDLKQGMKLKAGRKAAIIGLVAHPSSEDCAPALVAPSAGNTTQGNTRAVHGAGMLTELCDSIAMSRCVNGHSATR